MKTFRAKSGPFRERPHFEPGEIDRVCLDELRKTDCLPTSPQPIRIDRFIEKRFGIVPEYDDLPEGVLGYTKFSKKGVEAIVIAKVLDTDGGKVAERRIRSTLAHEGGHGLLHAYLFAAEDAGVSLFDSSPKDKDKILCRDVPADEARTRGYDGRWSEYQANRAIGGLLLPRKLVGAALEAFLVPTGALGTLTLDPRRRSEAERELAEVFDVNPVVAHLRIGDLFPLPAGGQLPL